MQYVFYSITILLCCSASLSGQKFHFGANAAFIASQVDGDNLRGYNKLGFSAGLLSGYAISESHWLVVELQYATFGSQQKKESSAMRVETEFNTLNILCGYAFRFGDAWDGTKKFRLLIGPRIHAIQNSNLDGDESTGLVNRYFVTGNVSLGVLLSDSFILDLSYNQGLTNILKTNYMHVEQLTPYYLSLGVAWYLFK